MRRQVILTLMVIILSGSLPRGSVLAESAPDSYLQGYAAAIVERDFQLSPSIVQVRDGVLMLRQQDLKGIDQKLIGKALSNIPGVKRVEIQNEHQETIHIVESPAVNSAFLQPSSGGYRVSSLDGIFLPKGQLFTPLFADPRWPNFSAAYLYYLHDDELKHVGAANFGGSIALYRNQAPFHGQWEFGLQAGVFSIFDLATDSKDLINSDFFVGVLGSYRRDALSGLLRLYHQSSHLGDEFLLRNRVKRINLSYEIVDFKLSYELFDLLRLYGGGGYLFDQEPPTLKPWLVNFGAEMESPWRFADGMLEPIAGIDFKLHEEHAWSTDFSVRGGVRLTNPVAFGRKLALLGEYFKGHSPHGQFYQRKIEYLGLGVHYYF